MSRLDNFRNGLHDNESGISRVVLNAPAISFSIGKHSELQQPQHRNPQKTLPFSTPPPESLSSFSNKERAPSGTGTIPGPFRDMPHSQAIRLQTEKSWSFSSLMPDMDRTPKPR